MSIYLKSFELTSSYEDFVEGEDTETLGEFLLPNVSYCKDTEDVHFNHLPPADVETETTTGEDGSETTVTVITYPDGSSEATTTVTNLDGSSSETQSSTTAPDENGTTVTTSSTVFYDENNEPMGTQSSTLTSNEDGSSSQTTISYDVNGDPTDKTNQDVDTSGNVNTQSIEYDNSGNEIVTGYVIDTTNNPEGSKSFNADGLNTEYYAFDLTHGFVLDFHFTIDFSNQPADQNQNHHNVLTMKRADPSPWYGFQLRQSGTNKYIQLGTQFATGSNTNTTISPTTLNGNVAEYNLRITYDPTKQTNTFVCTNMDTNTAVYSSNLLFPDLPELRYLKVTIGYSMDSNGEAYRYSNIDVANFSIRKLKNVATPSITCDGQHVTLTCSTSGASIYYRTGTGNYILYSNPFSINTTTTVQAYAQIDDEVSDTVTQTCVYDNGIEEPVITCDGQNVTITCATNGTTIYYRLGTSGEYIAYSTPISINTDTTVYAYAMLNGESSDIVSEECIYDNGIKTPVISCDGEYVTITCDTPSVYIYYRIGTSGSFTEYTSAIEINTNVTIQAYAELNGETSSTVTQNCTYVEGVDEPEITCDGERVTITCDTVGATIHYRLGTTGSYNTYSTPISISADTTVYAYATLSNKSSDVVYESCIYSPSAHDYSQDYLTFKILTSGNIVWKAVGSNSTKTIEYSIDNGSWTSITSTSSGVTIPVTANQSVRLRGSNTRYCEANKSNYSSFYGGTAEFDGEGNIMSLLYGDNFVGQTTLSTAWALSNVFNHSNMVSAENLVMPATTLTNDCYRATFANCPNLTKAPKILPATTLSTECYYYMFDNCSSLTTAPELPATTLGSKSYLGMFHSESANSINYIKCLATPNATNTQNWVQLSSGSNYSVAASGTFVKAAGTNWSTGVSGIPTGWVVVEDGTVIVNAPSITCDGEQVTITCSTSGATIYYRLGTSGSYLSYTAPISISADTTVQAYAELTGSTSSTTTQYCEYLSSVPIEASNRSLNNWVYNNQSITTPYSINAIDGHSSSYLKGTFNFETNVSLRSVQPTYLWFQHADQSAAIYVNNTLVEKHWGGYNSFFSSDLSSYLQTGSNTIKVALKNNEGNSLAPAAGDFNYNATLGNVKLFTSPVIPSTTYGYDGFHVTSTVTSASATVNVKTTVPSGASVACSISDNNFTFNDTKISDGTEMTFTTTINNPHLWNGTIDPHLYTITLEISKDNNLYHRYQRGYGLRYYEYLINDTTKVGTVGNPFTGFTLNGSPYLLRGVCMHHDIEGKANALSATDIANDFTLIQELGCNFIRLAHYPHPKEVYDWCDQLGIIVQTEAPCVNKMQSTMPADYYTHLTSQYTEMVNEHYNHPCILFWGLSNESTTDDKAFAKAKIEGYVSLIKSLDSERKVGYVMSHSYDDPYAYYNNPEGIDWLGCNLYVGWYISPDSNNPTTQLNTRVTKTITNKGKALALSEYGCGGTQHCHSEDFLTTTTRGNHERHDIEYQMWLHEGHIASIRNFPQLLFTGQWQLFDIAVSNRNEGYTICLDGENTSIDENLRRLNNKGLVERDHVTKKDTFYLYKAEWNKTQKFIHICGKDFTKTNSRVIKCYTNDYTNDQTPIRLYYTRGNNAEVLADTAYVSDNSNIIEFTSVDFQAGDIVRVAAATTQDTFTFAS